MKKNILIRIAAVAMTTFLAVGCSVETPVSVEVTARPTFASYTAIGNSLTAGYQDGALHMDGQLYSFPSLIARQMGLEVDIRSSKFTQPYLAHPGVGSPLNPLDPMSDLAGVSYWDGTTITAADPTPITGVPALHFTATSSSAPYNNLGVPGANLADSMENLTSGMFRIVLRNPDLSADGTSPSMIDWAATRSPSLVTVWLGNNDVLGAALYGLPITDPTDFATDYTAMMTQLITDVTARTGIAPTIVAANIPYVTSMAYFIPKLVFDTIYPIGYEDTATALINIRALGWISDAANVGQVVPSVYTLNTTQVTALNAAVDAYNTTIATVCEANGAGLVDVNELMTDLQTTGVEGMNGMHFLLLMQQPGMTVEAAAKLTAFSLDGVHPNIRGYGILANAFIDEINELSNGAQLGHVSVQDLTWDPTYGMPRSKAAAPGIAPITDRAADIMTGIFR